MVADHVLRRLHRARDRMHDEYAEVITVADLARDVNMSTFHFLREFDRAFGTTPRRYLSELRLDRARDLMVRGKSATEACNAVGFSSLGSFSTAFAARFGCSPRAFQRQMRLFASVPEKLVSLYVPTCFAGFWAGESNRGEVSPKGSS
jgi:AraC-like DNA-binding protein